MSHLNLNPAHSHYSALIGVGGIGAGTFFALNGNQPLGREESRGGRFLDRRDYCKLHIVSHYVKTLLGPVFAVIPIGRVGADEVGKRLIGEMREVGLDLRYVDCAEGEQTLFSFCFIYPDGSGGNLTTDDSASSHVDDSYVIQAREEFSRLAGRGVALALPEVPLAARYRLLELGTAHEFFRVASFTSAEIGPAITSGALASVDLLAVNVEEAAAAIDAPVEKKEPEEIVQSAIQTLRGLNPEIQLSITAGPRGSWSWDGRQRVHFPALPVEIVSSAGAGDAHLAGIVAGLATGLPLAQAQELGALVAALSVTSPHTINKEIDRESLFKFAATYDAPLSEAVRHLMSSPYS